METTNKEDMWCEDTYEEVGTNQVPTIQFPNIPNLQIIKIIGEPQLNSTNNNNNLAVDMQPCNSSCHANTEKCADRAIQPDEICGNEQTNKRAKLSSEAEIAELRAKVDRLEKENKYLKDLIDNKLDILIRNSARHREAVEELVAVSCPRQGLLSRNEFELAKLNTKEELDTFEQSISTDPSFKENVVRYLQRQITVADVDSRLHEALDLLFTRPFFATISWTGKSKPGSTKIEFRKCEGIILLLKEIGSNARVLATPKYVADFIKIRLKHAPSRANLSPTKHTSLHKKRN
ncbi:uncharacterized protein LOC118503140 [Anopheles stephensi]|uniref:uncharacterized protein LOC118503140 n=1 Tax=Anopheles stephensi TaxID=30069 RepID=UPI001658774A|nr:uncharacterized protein LOC118503140 [Anopheles stephensi]